MTMLAILDGAVPFTLIYALCEAGKNIDGQTLFGASMIPGHVTMVCTGVSKRQVHPEVEFP